MSDSFRRIGLTLTTLSAACIGIVHASTTSTPKLSRGFGVDVTRVIVTESHHYSASVLFTNGTDSDYISKNRILDYFSRKPTDIVAATPPVMLMPSGRQARVSAVVIDPEALPKDRESLFLLESVAYPGTADAAKESTAVVQLNFASALKVFVRPAGIEASMTQSIKDLKWTRKSGLIEALNDSPLHVSLAMVRFNGKEAADNVVVKPYGRAVFEFDAAGSVDVVWAGINDFGAMVVSEDTIPNQ